MVLSHTSGLPSWRPDDGPLRLHFQPGGRFSYSGEGFLYLQRVVEHISKLSLEEYFQKRVFQPLGMDHSSFVWRNDSDKASGHHSDCIPINKRLGIAPNAAYSLHTTALDYGKFLIALMEEKGLNKETVDDMFRSQISVPEEFLSSPDICPSSFSVVLSWGLGWGLQKNTLVDSFWHWGDNKGFKSFVIGFRKQKNTIIILTNSMNGLSLIAEVVRNKMRTSIPTFDWLDSTYSLHNNRLI